MVARLGFMSYFSQSFIPGKFSRLCILGVDIVGIPVVLVVGLPQSKALAVAGWFGLRVALTGLCYLEYRWDLARRSPKLEKFTREEKVPVQLQLPVVDPELLPNAGLPMTPMPAMYDEKTPIESDRVEFPRMGRDLTADPEAEIDAENGGRTERKVSLSSVDSDESMWTECETPAQMSVELPVEMSEEATDMETGEERWFSVPQEVVVAKAEPQPERKSFPLRRKHSKYGACPLVMRKSTASLCVSTVTAKT